MNPYTIINIFNVFGDNLSECYIAHYNKKKDAVDALRTILNKRGQVGEDVPVETLFEELVENGYAYEVDVGSQKDLYFVRHEKVQNEFNYKELTLDDVDRSVKRSKEV